VSAARGAAVRLEGLCKDFGGAPVVHDVSLEVAAGEFVSLLGPSGSGKSTTLMMIAGFISPLRGEVVIGDERVTRRPPHRRDIGVVFQNYALFPHMSVFDNVAFPLRMRRRPAAEVAARVERALALIRLEGLGARRPHQLSGGQQQRVALARAIVFEPPLLLMDGPLGALDRKLREAMQFEIKRLQRELSLTVIHVTHDQEEALAMSDRIAVMNRGRIEQAASPEAIYERPATGFVAGFLGECNALQGAVLRAGQGHALVRTDGGLELAACPPEAAAPGGRVDLAIRPERVALLAAGAQADNVIEAVVEEVVYLGESLRLLARPARGEALTVEVPRGTAVPSPGSTVRLGFAAAAVLAFEDSR
jgi:spermidine/putrescine ABC transporter ATP-binding subunit